MGGGGVECGGEGEGGGGGLKILSWSERNQKAGAD